MKIYMDVCCYNRPFDDLSQDRIYLEAEAILSIISHCENGDWILLSSGIIDYELSRISNSDRLEKIQALYENASIRLKLTTEAEERAKYFQSCGIKPFDSLHLALAETSNADVFISTDDKLIRTANRIGTKIKVVNPVTWVMEVTSDE